MKKQTKAAHIVLSLCALSPALGAFNLSLLSISMHDVAFNRFCLLFTFFVFLFAACFAHVVAVSLLLLFALFAVRSLELKERSHFDFNCCV